MHFVRRDFNVAALCDPPAHHLYESTESSGPPSFPQWPACSLARRVQVLYGKCKKSVPLPGWSFYTTYL